jgi:glycosyltransferase involved in cell wall biosynthesis
VYIAGRKFEAPHFFENLDVHPFEGDFSKIKMVVYPTHVEHQPRLVLKAISMGIPVLTNAACGLEPGDYLII